MTPKGSVAEGAIRFDPSNTEQVLEPTVAYERIPLNVEEEIARRGLGQRAQPTAGAGAGEDLVRRRTTGVRSGRYLQSGLIAELLERRVQHPMHARAVCLGQGSDGLETSVVKLSNLFGSHVGDNGEVVVGNAPLVAGLTP